MRTIIDFLTPHAQHYEFFFNTSEHNVRGMAVYARKFNSMMGIWLHDCKESDMVSLFDGNSPEVS